MKKFLRILALGLLLSGHAGNSLSWSGDYDDPAFQSWVSYCYSKNMFKQCEEDGWTAWIYVWDKYEQIEFESKQNHSWKRSIKQKKYWDNIVKNNPDIFE